MYEDVHSIQHTLPPNEAQPFSFITTVSWKFLRPNYELVKSPPPTFLFSVPRDIFYPFTVGSSL